MSKTQARRGGRGDSRARRRQAERRERRNAAAAAQGGGPKRDAAARAGENDVSGQVNAILVWLVTAGLMLVLATPLVVSPGAIFPFITGKAVFARVAIEIVVACWLILAWRSPAHRPPRGSFWLMPALWLALTAAASAFGVNPGLSFWSSYERMEGLFDLLHWAMLLVALTAMLRAPGQWSGLLAMQAGVSALVSMFGIAGYYDLIGNPLISDGDRRIDSTIGNAAYMGAYCGVSLLLSAGALGWLLCRRRLTETTSMLEWGCCALLFLATILCGWALWLTATRGALLGLAAALAVVAVVYAFWGRRRFFRRVAWGLLTLVGFGLLFLALLRFTDLLAPLTESSLTLERVSTIGLDDPNVRGRLVSAEAAVRGGLERPLLGWGPQNFIVPWARHVDPRGVTEYFDHAHNVPVEEFATKGAPGLLAYLLMWGVLLWLALRNFRQGLSARRTDDGDYVAADSGAAERAAHAGQLLAAGVGGGLVMHFVQGLFLFDSSVTLLSLVILAGFTFALAGPDRRPLPLVGRLWRRWPPLPSLLPRLRPAAAFFGRRRGLLAWPAGLALLAALGLLLAVNARVMSGAQQTYRAANMGVVLDSLFRQAYDSGGMVSDGQSDILNERLGLFRAQTDRAASAFPPLAAVPYRSYFVGITQFVGALPDEMFRETMTQVDAYRDRLLELGGDHVLLLEDLSRVYVAAALRDPETYAERAEESVSRLERLAPRVNFDSVNWWRDGPGADADGTAEPPPDGGVDLGADETPPEGAME